MVIKDLKKLQKLVQLCRKEGIEAFELGEMRFTLGAKPRVQRKSVDIANDFPEANIKIPQYNPVVSDKVQAIVEDVIKTDELTEEDLLFYSSRDEMIREQS